MLNKENPPVLMQFIAVTVGYPSHLYFVYLESYSPEPVNAAPSPKGPPLIVAVYENTYRETRDKSGLPAFEYEYKGVMVR